MLFYKRLEENGSEDISGTAVGNLGTVLPCPSPGRFYNKLHKNITHDRI
jgi:hypothetical protein